MLYLCLVKLIINQIQLIMAKSKIKGYVVYEGVSALNGKDIFAVVTLESNNAKTGNMASMWIMSNDIEPTKASKLGLDVSVCGDCKHRHFLGGSCYVILHQAPLQVYKSFKRDSYPRLSIEQFNAFNGFNMRFGAYGDPMALPTEILFALKSNVVNNTSYTHQWKRGNELQSLSMASVDSIEEAKQAHLEGWRTFRVTNDITKLLPNEIVCPNTTNNIQCDKCKLCNGNKGNCNSKIKSIVVATHGFKKKSFIEK